MGSTRHPTDWERQRAQLSAFLDGELSPAERAELERHLPGCAECRTELAELRRVRALLGALATPAVPRSFALPTATSGGSGRPPTRQREPAAATPSALYRASRWLGGVAASVGLFLLMGSALLGILSAGHPSGARNASSAPFAGSTAQSTQTTTHVAQDPNDASTPRLTETPKTPTSDQVTPTSASSTIQPTPDTGGSSDSPPLAPLAGLGLLAGGLIVLVAGRAARPRR